MTTWKKHSGDECPVPEHNMFCQVEVKMIGSKEPKIGMPVTFSWRKFDGKSGEITHWRYL